LILSTKKEMSNFNLFESKQIRTIWNKTDDKWYFVVTNVKQVLTDTPNPGDYINKKCVNVTRNQPKVGDNLSPPSRSKLWAVNKNWIVPGLPDESSTTWIVKAQNTLGFVQNKKAAKQGGAVAVIARRQLKAEQGKSGNRR
jgi:hypothetical protein